jgi:hypothetical protein
VQNLDITKSYECQAFVDAGGFYLHTFAGDSPSKDFIPFMIQLFEKENNKLLKTEYFHKLVRIKGKVGWEK